MKNFKVLNMCDTCQHKLPECVNDGQIIFGIDLNVKLETKSKDAIVACQNYKERGK